MDEPALMRTLWLPLAAFLVGCGPSGPRAQVPADTLRVMAYNIHHAEGMDEVIDLNRIAELILAEDPDVVTLQEVDSVVTRTGGVDQAAELGRLTGYQPVFGRFMPYQGGAYGMAVLSRWPVHEAKNLRLPDGDEPRSSVSVVLTSPATGRKVRVVGIHFYRTEEERLAQVLSLESQIPPDEIPTILAGDFNSQPGTAVMDQLALGWQVHDKGADRMTFPSFGPEREIDFYLHRKGDPFQVLEHRLLDEPVISDHRPLFGRLAW